jgi:hypothetical protein
VDFGVSDFFLTPTADWPISTGRRDQQDHVAENWKFHGYVPAEGRGYRRMLAGPRIFMELGKRLGQRGGTPSIPLNWMLE